MLEWVGDIGGIIEFFYFTSRFFLSYFAIVKLRAVLTNLLFHVQQDDTWSKHKQAEVSEGFPKPDLPGYP